MALSCASEVIVAKKEFDWPQAAFDSDQLNSWKHMQIENGPMLFSGCQTVISYIFWDNNDMDGHLLWHGETASIGKGEVGGAGEAGRGNCLTLGEVRWGEVL